MHSFVPICLLLVCQVLGSGLEATAQLIVAHRGASADAPENSISSFKLAWDQGADAIEGDFYLTADEQIVCIHDDTTERVSGVNLNVAASTLDQLQKLEVGSWKDKRFSDERIPTLQQVLATVPSGKKFFVEIKCGPEIVPFLKRVLLNSSVPLEDLKIISFDEEVIRVAKQELPEIDAFWIVRFKQDKSEIAWTPKVDEIIAIASRVGADGLDLQARMEVLDAGFVKRCRDAGFGLHTWVVDDPALAKHLVGLGFESITTNRPGFLQQALVEQEGTVPRTSESFLEGNNPSISLESSKSR